MLPAKGPKTPPIKENRDALDGGKKCLAREFEDRWPEVHSSAPLKVRPTLKCISLPYLSVSKFCVAAPFQDLHTCIWACLNLPYMYL